MSITDYSYYAKELLKIKTKANGLAPFHLREYQKKFIKFVQDIKGPKRVIALKPRQAGFSTLVASYFFHLMVTRKYYNGLAMADKKARTMAIKNIYSTFLQELPDRLTPMLAYDNSEQLLFDNPKSELRKTMPGMASGILYETANDPNAGRSSARLFAHLSENAFYRYYKEIDEGVQNSIPLTNESCVIKESTANGKAGVGKPFYDLWCAAEAGESLYKPFFVAWFEVDDYSLDPGRGFQPTPEEKQILEMEPSVTNANLMWRRLKLKEILDDEEEGAFLTPSEKFKQDYPLNAEQAFLSTGSPVFDPDNVSMLMRRLNTSPPNQIQQNISMGSSLIDQYRDGLKVFLPARKGKTYFIGADVAEGLAQGDSSSAFVMDEDYNQVARWHGKIRPDMFGLLLIALGDYYNKAHIIPERNNMGHTTVVTIRESMYPNLYKKVIEDKITKEKSTRFGWHTNVKTKNDMLNQGIKRFEDDTVRILDKALVREMGTVARGENGDVDLNGKDRVVAYCLALMGRKHTIVPIEINSGRKSRELYDLGPEKRNRDDVFD